MILGLVYGYIPFMILPLFGFLDRIDQHLLEAGRDLGAGVFQTFRRVTLPLSKPGILAGLVIVSLPMFGDYYTNDLLGSTNTSMFGNLIDEAVQHGRPGRGDGGSLVLILMVLVIVPMLYYLRETGANGGGGMSETTRPGSSPAPARSAGVPAPPGGWRDPWRKPRFLQAVTMGYLVWSLVPVVIAIVFSFNAGRSRSVLAGVLLAVVVPGRVRFGLARPGAPVRDVPDVPALADHDVDRRAAWDRVRDRDRPLARAAGRRRELPDAALVRDARDHPGRLAVPAVLEPPGGGGPARDHGAAARAHHVPDLVPVHHRAGPSPIDRVRVRGIRDGSGGLTDPGVTQGASAAARAGDPGERGARVRRHGRRLRDRPVPVGACVVRAAVREDLLCGAFVADARRERGRDDHAGHDADRDRSVAWFYRRRITRGTADRRRLADF